jgi:hypothetical protein
VFDRRRKIQHPFALLELMNVLDPFRVAIGMERRQDTVDVGSQGLELPVGHERLPNVVPMFVVGFDCRWVELQ